MALPPTIPTSFLPHQQSSVQQRISGGLSGAFSLTAYGLFVLAIVISIGVFIYGSVLSNERTSKDAQLAKAQAAIDPATVETFVRLRNRLTSGETLLNNHVALTGFLTAVESLLPTTLRFTSLHVSVDQSGAVHVEGSGLAKSFNALAATSVAFGKDGRIKDVIFSNITVNHDNSVAFSITADLDPKLVTFTGAPVASQVNASSTQSLPSL